ncbi:unknown [Clostridium sp. CAG:921]|nr:unknown [Clostridium sp. CAG:921]
MFIPKILFATIVNITYEIITPITPAIAPSFDFFGLILGHNLCFPNLLPIRYPNISDMKAPSNTSQIYTLPYSIDNINFTNENKNGIYTIERRVIAISITVISKFLIIMYKNIVINIAGTNILNINILV